MSEPIDDVRISDDSAGVGDQIETELLHSLRETLPQTENQRFVLTARNSDGRLVGGVVASTSYGWLLVKALWVDAAYRRRLFGRTLLEHAESRARAIGCHGAWLDTSNPHARQFYEKLGYATFGRLKNELGQCPEGHRRWFMQKVL